MDDASAVEIVAMRKVYLMGDTEVVALDDVNLQIPRGSFTVVMGPSGSGKSTLLYLVGGLDWPTSGTIKVWGEEIGQMDENTLAGFRRTKVGFVFQSFNLVATMSAAENVAFPMRFSGARPAARKSRSLELLQSVGLSDRAAHKPTELSGGQQQRVAIARALVHDPPLLLADEPTGNLDSSSGYSIMQLLAELHQSGKTILVVTHDVRMLQFATHTIYLLDGMTVNADEFRRATEPGLHEKAVSEG
jgi:putative ABC transport system ATP-binding protein